MPGQVDLARGWLHKGDNDLAALRLLLQAAGPLDIACFHAQQSAEKHLKALVALSARSIPRTHDLETIYDSCLLSDPGLRLDRARLATLTPYAVHLRYSPNFFPDRATAEEALQIAEEVRVAVVALLPPAALPPGAAPGSP